MIACLFMYSRSFYYNFEQQNNISDYHYGDASYDPAREIINQTMLNANRTYGFLDNSVLLIFFVMCIVLIGTAFFIPSHPILIAPQIVGIIVIIMASAYLSNTYQDLHDTPSMAKALDKGDGTNYFANTDALLTNWMPRLLIIVVIVTTVLMFGKWTLGGSGGSQVGGF